MLRKCRYNVAMDGLRLIGYYIPRLILLVSVIALASCAGTRRNPLPEKYFGKSHAVGLPQVRDLGDKHSKMFQRDFIKSIKQTGRYKNLSAPSTVNFLALSGGGSNGAYGAGILNGWTARGDRPSFKLVTGISTGALIAPFAFLGPKYDGMLRDFYTKTTTKDIIRKRSFLEMLAGADSVVDTKPLANLINKLVNKTTLSAIAKEYRKGRRLFIGTTNLDARKFIIWNMGAIAAQGTEQSRKLFRQVILASASMPVAFPPVIINVKAPNGKIYDEMHVDGGVSTQVFMYGFMLDFDQAKTVVPQYRRPKIRLYIIRNNQLYVPYKPVKKSLISIASRSISNLTTSQGIGDLYRIYQISKRDRIDFHLAYIPSDFHATSVGAFDPVYMRKLYDLGYRLARKGYPWMTQPPGYSGKGF